MGPCESTNHKHPRASWALRRQGSLVGPWDSTPPARIHEHPARCTGRDRSWVQGRAPHPRACTSILCTAWAGIAHRSWESPPAMSIREQPVCCTRRKTSWAHGIALHPRAFTSILCVAQVGRPHGPMGEHPIHEHPRASCVLHRYGSLMGPWESTPSTSILEHPVHCTSRDRSCDNGKAPHPRASTCILCAAQVGISM